MNPGTDLHGYQRAREAATAVLDLSLPYHEAEARVRAAIGDRPGVTTLALMLVTARIRRHEEPKPSTTKETETQS